MAIEILEFSIPGMQCSACEGYVTDAITTAVVGLLPALSDDQKTEAKENTQSSLVDVKINPYEKHITVIIRTIKALTNRLEIIQEIKNQIKDKTTLDAYLPGCNLKIVPQKPERFEPDQWFLVRPENPKNQNLELYRATPNGKTLSRVPAKEIGLDDKILNATDPNKDAIKECLVNYQKNLETSIQKRMDRWYKFKMYFSGGLGGIVVILSALSFVIAPWAAFSIACLTLCISIDIFSQALQALRSRQWNSDVWFSAAILACVGFSLLFVFCPVLGGHAMFEMPLFILANKYYGMTLMEDVLTTRPKYTERFDNIVPLDHPVQTRRGLVKVGELKKGDIIKIPRGTLVPVNGRAEQKFSVDSTLTHYGAIAPVWIEEGGPVSAGTRVCCDAKMSEPPVSIEVTETADNSYLAQLDQYERSQSTPAVAPALHPLVWILMLILAITVLTTGAMLLHAAILSVMSMALLVFCPCVASFINVSANIAAVKKLKAEKITCKEVEIIERIEKNKKIGFDYNGTLTKGTHEIQGIFFNKSESPQELAEIFYTLENGSDHSLAKKIREAFKNEDESIDDRKDVTNINSTGSGMSGYIGEVRYAIGDKITMKNLGISVGEVKVTSGAQIIYMARDKKYVGTIPFFDPLRDKTVDSLKEIEKMGKKPMIFTGAHKETLNAYLELPSDIPRQCECVNLPEEAEGRKTKIEAVCEGLSGDENAAYVCEGQNDAPIMKMRNIVGIAIEAPSQSNITHQRAQVIIPDIESVPVLFKVANANKRHKRMNYVIAYSSNILSVGIASICPLIFTSLGFLWPGVGFAIMTLSFFFIRERNKWFERDKSTHREYSVPSPAKANDNTMTTTDLTRTFQKTPTPRPEKTSLILPVIQYYPNPLHSPRQAASEKHPSPPSPPRVALRSVSGNSLPISVH